MELQNEILQGEKLLEKMMDFGNQLHHAWQDPNARIYLEKYFTLCDSIRQDLVKLNADE